MFLGRLIVAGIVLIVLQGCNEISDGEASFSRSDCIVRIDVIWPTGTTYDEKVDIVNKVRTPDSLRKVVAGYMIKSEGSPDSIYIQFYPDGCGRKHDLAEDFMRGVGQEVSGMPQHNVSNDRISPSTKTIDLKGAVWR